MRITFKDRTESYFCVHVVDRFTEQKNFMKGEMARETREN